MAQIRAKDTKPERIVRSLLHRLGARFRLHRKDLPGKPDVVLPRYGLIVLVHGCYWHRHAQCKYAYKPKSRVSFWTEKFKTNVKRDRKVQRDLKSLGWKVVIVWECETRDLDALEDRLELLLRAPSVLDKRLLERNNCCWLAKFGRSSYNRHQSIGMTPMSAARLDGAIIRVMKQIKRRRRYRLQSWERAENEKGDFYHLVRQFPPDVTKWRKQFVDQVVRHPDVFTGIGSQLTLTEVRALAAEGISWLREVSAILELLYSKHRDLPFTDPLDELVARLIGQSIGNEVARQAVIAIRSEFSDWDKVRTARIPELRRAADTNLPADVVRLVKSMLTEIHKRFGSCTLAPLRKWGNEKLEEFFVSLPGVAPDDARSLMAESLDRQVFVADRERTRVLSRLGPYRDLGLNMKQIHHSKRQHFITSFLPPSLRLVLHHYLSTHAHQVCHAKRPDCTTCGLKKFCQHYRENTVKTIRQEQRTTFVDLFSGAGGMSTGFVLAGFSPVLAIDNNPAAMRTYALNHPQVPRENVLTRDIQEVSARDIRSRIGRKSLDVLVGAPPCQGFSLVGNRTVNGKASEFHSVVDRKSANRRRAPYRPDADVRNYLFEYMVALALTLRPKLFLMENVPGMKSTRLGKTSFIDAAREQLEAGGYKAEIWRLRASAFGVPQDRTRLFLVASRLRTLPVRPEQEYWDSSSHTYDDYSLPPVTFDEATFDLPPLKANSGSVIRRSTSDIENSSRFKRYLRKFQIYRNTGLIFNHLSRYQNDRDLELYQLLRPGENSVAAIERYGRRDLMRYRQDVFDDKYLKLRADRPCRTIVSHLAKDGNGYIHPEQTRSITVREAARIQSFDDEFIFCGSQRDQWAQVGNAVPPLLAKAIAVSFQATLDVS